MFMVVGGDVDGRWVQHSGGWREKGGYRMVGKGLYPVNFVVCKNLRILKAGEVWGGCWDDATVPALCPLTPPLERAVSTPSLTL